jgi:Aminotransferase class-V
MTTLSIATQRCQPVQGTPSTAMSRPDPAADDLTLVGSELEVPLVTGARRRYVNLDYAASAPCLTSVKRAVDALLPWYASVHRGAGYKSQLATEAYEGARAAVSSFVGAHLLPWRRHRVTYLPVPASRPMPWNASTAR